MRPVPPVPPHGPTPPMPDTTADYERIVKGLYAAPPIPSHVPSSWQGSRSGAVPIDSEHADISPSPQETRGRRQGSPHDPANRRAGPVRAEGEGWVYAPSTSHISRFRFTDARGNGEVSAFGPQGGASQLQVVFKGPPLEPGGIGQGEVAEYVYYYADHDAGAAIYDELRRSPHPYGSVLDPKVIKAGVPYHPLARS